MSDPSLVSVAIKNGLPTITVSELLDEESGAVRQIREKSAETNEDIDSCLSELMPFFRAALYLSDAWDDGTIRQVTFKDTKEGDGVVLTGALTGDCLLILKTPVILLKQEDGTPHPMEPILDRLAEAAIAHLSNDHG